MTDDKTTCFQASWDKPTIEIFVRCLPENSRPVTMTVEATDGSMYVIPMQLSHIRLMLSSLYKLFTGRGGNLDEFMRFTGKPAYGPREFDQSDAPGVYEGVNDVKWK